MPVPIENVGLLPLRYMTNPQSLRVEMAEEVSADIMLASHYIMLASHYIAKDRLGSTDDCGFSPFSIDVKPKHGSPDVARDVAFQKIRAQVEGTRMASNALGLS